MIPETPAIKVGDQIGIGKNARCTKTKFSGFLLSAPLQCLLDSLIFKMGEFKILPAFRKKMTDFIQPD
jgi:hypothetical protein